MVISGAVFMRPQAVSHDENKPTNYNKHFHHFVIYHSGCADESSEGLESKIGITACKGSWDGHIHNSGHLCAIGWKVCGWDDSKLLGTLKWDESISIEGCFAYNAAQEGGVCEPCTGEPKLVSHGNNLACIIL